MTDLTTAAGLRMLDDYFDLQRDSGPQVYAAIHAIEVEAAAAERDRIDSALGEVADDIADVLCVSHDQWQAIIDGGADR